MTKYTKEKRGWIIGSIVVIVCAAVLLSLAYWLLFWSGDTRKIESTANQISIEPGWELETESIQPPRAVCIDVECPSVYKKWKVNNPIQKDDMARILRNSGWSLRVNDNCNTENMITGSPTSYCEATGLVDGYRVTLAASGSKSDSSNYYLGLSVKRD